ncbi:n-alpha-acetyltransferase 50 [Anaeramoeba flamelloides]|uniref:N-alpha-acetyltransferase 50 n=1 Tax=Anaeramoeba flamelloides TaxID=1746091 RepID=A0ABQ8YL57_9EUKA|nr:n-alpha-acetyltransferase 50 [Anaeramoeba flamelloides]
MTTTNSEGKNSQEEEKLDNNKKEVNQNTKIVQLEDIKKQFLIRLVQQKDLKRIKILDYNLFGTNSEDEFYPTLIDNELCAIAIPHNKNFVVCGYCSSEIKKKPDLENNIADFGYINALCVSPKFSSKGLGYNLLNIIIKKLFNEKKVYAIYLHVQKNNIRGISFYQKFGFIITKEKPNYYYYLEKGTDALVMTLYSNNFTNDQEIDVNSITKKLENLTVVKECKTNNEQNDNNKNNLEKETKKNTNSCNETITKN